MISVVIPTVDERDAYLNRCIRGYEERTNDEVQLIIINNSLTCSMGWQKGSKLAKGDYLHFTSDDIVPHYDWDIPCKEAVEAGNVPVCGVYWGPDKMDEDEMPTRDASSKTYSYYEDHKIYKDWEKAPKSDNYYPSVPFCSMKQWECIGPMIAAHYGGDKWFGYKAKKCGYWPVVRSESRFFHYAALEARDKMSPGWYTIDRITYDLQFAFPMYVSGKLAPEELPPEWNTDEGLRKAREWYIKNVRRPSGGYLWEKTS